MHTHRHLISAAALTLFCGLALGSDSAGGPALEATSDLSDVGSPGTITLVISNPGEEPLTVDGVGLQDLERSFAIDAINGAPPVRNTSRDGDDFAVDLTVSPGLVGTIEVQVTPAIGGTREHTVEVCLAGSTGCWFDARVPVAIGGQPTTELQVQVAQVIAFSDAEVDDLTSDLEVEFRGVSTNAKSGSLMVLVVQNNTLQPTALKTTTYTAKKMAWVWEEPDPFDDGEIEDNEQLTHWPTGTDSVMVPAQGELEIEAEVFTYSKGGVDWQSVEVCTVSAGCVTVRP
jgi:hypothetical protein